MSEFQSITEDVIVGKDVYLGKFINLYGCRIGDQCRIGPFVEVQRGVSIGKLCKISSHTFICAGVGIGDEVFVGHGVMFINDRYPKTTTASGTLENSEDWKHRFEQTVIEDRVSIGSNTTIMCGVTIGKGAAIGAGSVVVSDIPAGEVWVGNPARFLKTRS